MKNILLASTALVAFAGAASADISLSGTGKIGYNDDHEGGVYTDLDVDFKFSQELDNGWTAAGRYGFEFADGAGADSNADFGSFDDNNLQLSLTSDFGGVYYGDYEFAAATYWSGVSDMDTDGFSEQDGETVIRAEAIFGDFKGGVSYAVDNGTGDTEQLSLGVSGSVANFTVAAAYQEDTTYDSGEDDWNADEVFGLALGTSFAGADVTFAYSSSNDENSIGLGASYAVSDAITVSASYVVESVDDADAYGFGVEYSEGPFAVSFEYDRNNEEDEFFLEGSYEVSDLVTVYAGYVDDEGNGDTEAYVAAEYDLGSSASVLASYGSVGDAYTGDSDEVGNDYEVFEGVTLQLTLKF